MEGRKGDEKQNRKRDSRKQKAVRELSWYQKVLGGSILADRKTTCLLIFWSREIELLLREKRNIQKCVYLKKSIRKLSIW